VETISLDSHKKESERFSTSRVIYYIFIPVSGEVARKDKKNRRTLLTQIRFLLCLLQATLFTILSSTKTPVKRKLSNTRRVQVSVGRMSDDGPRLVSIILMSRARILGKMDYFYFLRHMYETCL
jgi:hypothetical protein